MCSKFNQAIFSKTGFATFISPSHGVLSLIPYNFMFLHKSIKVTLSSILKNTYFKVRSAKNMVLNHFWQPSPSLHKNPLALEASFSRFGHRFSSKSMAFDGAPFRWSSPGSSRFADKFCVWQWITEKISVNMMQIHKNSLCL